MRSKAFQRISALLSQPATLGSFIDELPLGIAIIDTDGNIVLVNRAYETLTGMESDYATGLGCLHVLRCGYCMTGCPLADKRLPHERISTTSDILDRNRKKTPVRVTISPIKDQHGHISGVLETIIPNDKTDPLGATGEMAYTFGGLVGQSPEIQKVFSMIPSIAQTDSSVLITGETGTGKDMLAEAIHKASDRATGPFVKVNCGALPDTLLESELFGHSKGAFTGADRDKPGRVRMAHGGTLFLTEIGDMPLNLQVKLLSFLDDKTIHPLGSTTAFHADVRVIVGTHRNLQEMVSVGTFRQDLLYRLNVIRFHMPPLRERQDDIMLLQKHFLKNYCERFGKKISGFSDGASALLNTYPYPGNIRELRNIIEFAVNFCDGDKLRMAHLPPYLQSHQQQPMQPVSAPLGMHPQPARAVPSITPGLGHDDNWDQVERKMIMDALVRSGGKKQKAADLLGWGRSTLWRKMKRHGIEG